MRTVLRENLGLDIIPRYLIYTLGRRDGPHKEKQTLRLVEPLVQTKVQRNLARGGVTQFSIQ